MQQNYYFNWHHHKRRHSHILSSHSCHNAITLTHAFAVISNAKLTGTCGFECKVIVNLCLLLSKFWNGRFDYISPVGWLVGRSFGVTISFPSPNVFPHFLLGFCSSPERNYNNNDHPYEPASCKLSSWWTSLLQMIIRMNRPLANDHPHGPARRASRKW